MTLKSWGLTLLVATSITSSNQTHSFDISCKNVALIAAASIAGIAVGKVAYDYFFALTDAQEFENAIKLCEQSEELINTIDQTYAHTLSITLPATIHYLPYHNRLWTTIISQSHQYPLSDYVYALEGTIKQIIAHEDKLSQTKIHIFERRANLLAALNSARPEEAIGMKSSIEGYDFVMQELQSTIKKLKLRRKNLQKIKSAIVTNPHYIIEQQQLRIEKLERNLRNNYSTHYYTLAPVQPVNRIYIHNTHITHAAHPTKPQEAPVPQQVTAEPSAPEKSELADAAPCPQQDQDPRKKNKQNQDDQVWRDRFCELGDNFNG